MDADRFKLSGGCTALLVIFILGKMYVASAGDCRAVLCRSENSDVNKTSQSESKVVALPMSQDFTPGTERRRLQYLVSGNICFYVVSHLKSCKIFVNRFDCS